LLLIAQCMVQIVTVCWAYANNLLLYVQCIQDIQSYAEHA
jgi:hypothetical protein